MKTALLFWSTGLLASIIVEVVGARVGTDWTALAAAGGVLVTGTIVVRSVRPTTWLVRTSRTEPVRQAQRAYGSFESLCTDVGWLRSHGLSNAPALRRRLVFIAETLDGESHPADDVDQSRLRAALGPCWSSLLGEESPSSGEHVTSVELSDLVTRLESLGGSDGDR